MNICDYATLVFDCDGVVFNSNKVKTNAFYSSALPYGEEAATSLVNYHIARGGVSRYKKFEWFIQEEVRGRSGPDLHELLSVYGDEVRRGLLNCEIADGLFELREKTKGAKWLLVSGGDQTELREIFGVRGLSDIFDGGIYGSPDNKDVILERELFSGNIRSPSIFFGDSEYDYTASARLNMDFIFLVKWTEFVGWESFFSERNVCTRLDIKALL